MLVSALLLAALPQGGAAPRNVPQLPAPLAWLVDRQDHPLVSRRVVVLEPGASEPRVVLESVLYCFDAADHQAVAWVGERLLVNGPVSQHRERPNVPMPLAVLDPRDGSRRELGIEPIAFSASPDGEHVLCRGAFDLQVVPLEGGERQALLDRERLGESVLQGSVWLPGGDAVLVSVRGFPRGMAGGLWRLGLDGCEPLHVGTASGRLLGSPVDGSVLLARRVERERYTPHELWRVRLGTPDAPERLAWDLHWNLSAALRPQTPEVAFVKAGPDAWIGLIRDGDEQGRSLLHGPGAAESLTWSPDGDWLAFSLRVDGDTPRIVVREADGAGMHVLGEGLRPAWGPLAR